MGAVERIVESEAVDDLCVRRLTEDRLSPADHDWNARDTDTKSIEHLLCIRVAIEIDVPERMSVPGQELPHVQRPRVVRRSEHYDVAQVPGDQSQAPLQECA